MPAPARFEPGVDQIIVAIRVIWWAVFALRVAGRWIHMPFAARWFAAIEWLMLIGLCVILMELLVALGLCIADSGMRRQCQAFVRIRAPHPLHGMRPVAPPRDFGAFWHAFVAFAGSSNRQPGKPGVAMLLSALPNAPLDIGMLVASDDEQATQSVLQTLRPFLSAFLPEVVAERSPDPLAAVIANNTAVLVTAELRLRYSDHLPIRMPCDDADLLALLAAHIRPSRAGIAYVELQVLPRPADDQHLRVVAWRAAARRRLERAWRGGRAARGPAPHDLASLLERKYAGSTWFVTLRLVVVAASERMGMQQVQAVAAALGPYNYGQLGSGQQIVVCSIQSLPITTGTMRSQKARDALERRAHALSPFPPLLLPVAIRRQPLLLGGDELAGFWHLPAASLGAQIAWLPNRRLPAAPHAFHSQPSSRQARCIVLGYAEQADGTLAPVGPALRDLRQIMHVTAGMGAGKSRLLANLARQMFETGLFLIDGKGDDAGNLAHTVARLVPREDEHRLVWLDIADRDWPIGINPLAAYDPMQPGALDQLVSMLEATFARLDPETWRQAPGMQQFLGHAARLTCQAQPGATLLHLQRLLIDETYRDALLRLAPETDATRFWRQVFPRMPESQRGSLLALLRRFEKLLGSELLRGMLSQPRSTIDLTRIFDERLIVLCPIPHVTYGSLAGTAATLLFMLFVRAAFARPGSAETRADYPLVVDELQVLVEQGATQDVSLALTQLRSLGVPAVYAHQTLGQLGDLRDVLLVNAENRVIIRTQEPDASVYARQYAASGLTASDISEQEPHSHQYARFLVEGRPVPPCSIVPLPWPVGPGEEETATQHHHDWRAIVPPGSAAQQQYDRSVARMIYAPYHPGVTRQLAAVDDSDWALFCERWHAIAATQRAALLCNRALAPHTAERQRWLSRLAYARPRLLVEAEQARLR